MIVPSRDAFKFDDQAVFLQTANFQFLLGQAELVASVLVLDGRAKTSTLFLSPPHPAITRPRPAVGAESARTLGRDAVLPVADLDGWLRDRLATTTGVLVSGTDARGSRQAPTPMANSVGRWRAYLGGLGWQGEVTSGLPVLGPIREIRIPEEIAIVQRVATASGQAMLAGLRGLRPGRTQREAEVDVVAACAAAGARHSFWPWTMSGPHAAFTDLFNSFVDYESHNRAMQASEVVRLDVGCQIDHYMGDVGRTAPVSGRFGPGSAKRGISSSRAIAPGCHCSATAPPCARCTMSCWRSFAHGSPH